MARTLRAVPANEQPAPVVKSVAQAAKAGSQRELLVAMRDRIAETVSKADCPPRDLASLTKRLQDIARDIAALDAVEGDARQQSSVEIDESFDSSAI